MNRTMQKMVTSFLLVLITVSQAASQNDTLLTLDQSYQWAEQNYPMIRQKGLVRQSAAYTISNIKKGYLPQVTVTGKATYQSAVTSIPINIQGIDIPIISKDQYQLVAEVDQLIYDGGNNVAQRNVQQVNALVEEQKAEVDLYNVKDRINQLYLGILLLDEQVKQEELVKKDIRLGINKVSAQIDNGTAFRSNKLTLEAELLQHDQNTIELLSGRKAYVEMLALFLNHPLSDKVQLAKPPQYPVINDGTIIRPELKLYNYQDSLYGTQRALINAKNRPNVSFFVQGGYGKPGLNLLKNSFDFFYIGGLQFRWALGNLYTAKKEKQILEVNQKMVGVQRDVFLLNTNTQLKQQEEEIAKMYKLMEVDTKIISMREKVKEAANAQLEYGVITVNDFLKEVNAENQARQALIAHRIQLLQAQINYLTLTGKQ